MKNQIFGLVFALATTLSTGQVLAEEVTLRLHQFLPPQATIPAKVLKPWAQAIEEQSDGRLKIEHFDAMALGGRPPALYGQAQDGVVDIVMTLTGYTPNRFIESEVFELPFMMRGTVPTSLAYWQLIEDRLQDAEFADTQVIAGWVHGAGVIHSDREIATLDDMNGVKLRGPTRIINDMLTELGAVPIGMPLPGIPEALSKGVIDGTVIPWEVTPSLRLSEMLNHATEFKGERALYTATIIVAMNKAKYDALPDDLRTILDRNSGVVLSRLAAEAMNPVDAPGRQIAIGNGTTITVVDPTTWETAAKPVTARWIEQVKKRGVDGAVLIDEANALIDAAQN